LGVGLRSIPVVKEAEVGLSCVVPQLAEVLLKLVVDFYTNIVKLMCAYRLAMHVHAWSTLRTESFFAGSSVGFPALAEVLVLWWSSLVWLAARQSW
jgi:hypothetical protein